MRSNSSVASPESWLRSAVSSIPEISRIAAFGSHESWGIGHERTKIGQVWFQVNEGGTCLANAKVGGRGREDNIVLWATSKTVLAEQVIGRINQSVKSGKLSPCLPLLCTCATSCRKPRDTKLVQPSASGQHLL